MKHIVRLSTCVLLAVTLAGCQQQPQATATPQDAAAQLASIQKQQQEAAAQAQHDAELKKQVEQNRKKSSAFNVTKTKTWTNYIP